MDPAGRLEHPPARPVVAQVAVVAEGEPAGRVVEWLGVGQGQGRQPRRPAEMDEQAGRLDPADRVPARVIAEGAHVAVAGQPAGSGDPGGAPAEAGDPVLLELLHERKELVDPERALRAGNEVLTHQGR